MNRYIKMVNIGGHYFIKEFEKKKKHANKVRQIKDYTIKKFFLEGDCEILVHFEETGREVLVTPDSDEETIKRYLGEDYIR